MDGSTASLIAIPIVTTLALAAWLIVVAYAASHPQWKHRIPAAGHANPGLAPADGQLVAAVPRQAVRSLSDSDAAAGAHPGAIPDQQAQLAA